MSAMPQTWLLCASKVKVRRMSAALTKPLRQSSSHLLYGTSWCTGETSLQCRGEKLPSLPTRQGKFLQVAHIQRTHPPTQHTILLDADFGQGVNPFLKGPLLNNFITEILQPEDEGCDD